VANNFEEVVPNFIVSQPESSGRQLCREIQKLERTAEALREHPESALVQQLFTEAAYAVFGHTAWAQRYIETMLELAKSLGT